MENVKHIYLCTGCGAVYFNENDEPITNKECQNNLVELDKDVITEKDAATLSRWIKEGVLITTFLDQLNRISIGGFNVLAHKDYMAAICVKDAETYEIVKQAFEALDFEKKDFVQYFFGNPGDRTDVYECQVILNIAMMFDFEVLETLTGDERATKEAQLIQDAGNWAIDMFKLLYEELYKKFMDIKYDGEKNSEEDAE